MNKNELSSLCKSFRFSDSEIDQLFQSIDSNSDGKIAREEFVDSFTAVVGISEDSNNTNKIPKKYNQDDSTSSSRKSRFDGNSKPKINWDDFILSVGDSIYTLFR